MPQVSATEFVRSFGRLQDEAHREIVEVTSHGRVIGAYLSAPELERYKRLRRREREVFRVEELPDDLAAAIEAAEYGRGPG